MWRLANNLGRRISSWSWPFSKDDASGINDAQYLRVALPGIAPEHVEVNVAGHTVHIRAFEKQGTDDEVSVTHYEEMIALPEFIDTEKINATFRHGLLELTLPYKDELKPRRIEISTGEQKQLPKAA